MRYHLGRTNSLLLFPIAGFSFTSAGVPLASSSKSPKPHAWGKNNRIRTKLNHTHKNNCKHKWAKQFLFQKFVKKTFPFKILKNVFLYAFISILLSETFPHPCLLFIIWRRWYNLTPYLMMWTVLHRYTMKARCVYLSVWPTVPFVDPGNRLPMANQKNVPNVLWGFRIKIIIIPLMINKKKLNLLSAAWSYFISNSRFRFGNTKSVW